MSLLPRKSGRDMRIMRNGAVVSVVRGRDLRIDNTPVIVTGDNDDGFATLLERAGSEQIQMSISGLVFDQVFLDDLLSGTVIVDHEIQILDENGSVVYTISVNFFLNNVKDFGDSSDALKFSAKLISTGTFTASGSISAPSTMSYFDVNSYWSLAIADLGVANGKTGMISCWIKLDATQPFASSPFIGSRYPVQQRAFEFALQSGLLRILIHSATTSNFAVNVSTTTSWSGTNLVHVLAAWDVAAGKAWIFANGVSQPLTGVLNILNQPLKYADNQDIVLFGPILTDPGNQKFVGEGGMMYLNFTEILDFDDPTSITKFYRNGGAPDMGVNGEKPTGSVPQIFTHNASADNPPTNYGSGPEFRTPNNGNVIVGPTAIPGA